jgi:A/G-specific adenine glycosylase
LPGIGRYTAGAILSIAFDQRQPILEANSLRLLARLTGLRENPRRSAGAKRLWEVAEELLPRRGTGKFNQALMELGSLVCTPRSPRCAQCPLQGLCKARELGLQESIPGPSQRPRATRVREAAVVIRRGRKLLLMQYLEGGRWEGLWDFLRFPLASDTTPQVWQELKTKTQQLTGLHVRPVQHVATIQHGVTRYRITLECHLADHVAGRIRRSTDHPMQWVQLGELSTFPLHATGRTLERLLADRALIPAKA